MIDLVRRVVQDRFFIFALIGVGFFLWELRQSDTSDIIEVTPGDVAMLESRWTLQSGSTPSEQELQALIANHVREEIMVREALRLGLDQGDIIVRRRLVQKMELLVRDQQDDPVLTQEAIEQYYQTNKDSYAIPKRVGFRHIYLGAGPHAGSPPEGVDAIIRELAETDQPDRWRGLGSAFMLAREYAPRPQTAFMELFGSAFAARLMEETQPGGWIGPVRSSYGWHLVQILSVEPERQLSLSEAGERVASDLRAEQTTRQMDAVFDEISERYTVDADWRAE